ncbi:AMP-binding protein [Nocardioides bruguierae]|uniref:AMP-binding protein n=1 Tax=Nocardioides bruguierae TaxID=2945102 RepID=UPI002020D23D|nr:AMP-binding protein [Nocardioides bruguierae]MCL8025902.1 AMP-binding protein [Nocardioides bruguierae]
MITPVRDRDGLHTLGRWTTDRAKATPARPAIDDRGVVLTYAELDARAGHLADALVAAGYAPGQRIATLSGNSADQVVLFFACAKAGLVLVPLSWRLAPPEIAAQVADCDPAVLVVEDEFSSLAAAALEDPAVAGAIGLEPTGLPVVRFGRQGIEHGVPAPRPTLDAPDPGSPTAGGPGGAPRPPVADDDPLLIIFTSGTQSRARGAVLTHANCFWTNLSLSRTAEVTSRDVVLAVMPQFHVGGWNIQPLLAWWMGATVVLERTFDAGRVLHLIEERRITTTMGVPATYLMLSQHPGFEAADLSSLRHAIVGGAPMPEPLLRTWHRRGVALTQGYGLTEAAPNVLCLPPEEATARVGMAGTPYPHVEVDLVDPVTDEVLVGPGRGELVVRGPNVFAGYFRQPATRPGCRHGLHTGDLAERDVDGYYRIVDRLTDLFISGGEQVSPAEVEAVLLAHAGVADAAVIGVPSARWGEVGVAFVVLRDGVPTDAEDLLEHCRGRLARFKVPSQVEVVTQVPRTSSDKILRRALAQEWRERTPTQEGPR